MALADGDLEGHEVQLTQRSLIDHRIDGASFELRVVSHEVLDRGEDPLRLDAAYVASSKEPGQQGVFRIALEIAAGQRMAMQIHGRRQEATTSPVKRLPSHKGAKPLRQCRVPAGTNGRTTRNTRGTRSAEAREGWAPCAVGPIGHPDLGDTQSVDRRS